MNRRNLALTHIFSARSRHGTNRTLERGYPLQRNSPVILIRKFVDESSKNVKRLIDVAPSRDCAEKLLPIFHGEMEAAGLISNNKKKLSVSGESSVNGVVSVEIPSELDEKFTTIINLRLLSGVPFNFDVYVNPERTDRLFLSDENGSRIVLMSLK